MCAVRAPEKIHTHDAPRGKGSLVRSEPVAPDELMHVRCTRYVSPNGAQKVFARRGWQTRVTNAYHMGCYAALPALRIASGFVATGAERVDIARSHRVVSSSFTHSIATGSRI